MILIYPQSKINSHQEKLDEWFDKEMRLLDKDLYDGLITQEEHARYTKEINRAYQE